jgi:hypothetical protein
MIPLFHAAILVVRAGLSWGSFDSRNSEYIRRRYVGGAVQGLHFATKCTYYMYCKEHQNIQTQLYIVLCYCNAIKNSDQSEIVEAYWVL